MAAAPRGFEIASADQGKTRAQHPKEAWHGPSQPPRHSGKAGLAARGLAKVRPPAQTPRAPGSPWRPRTGCLLTVPTSRGQLGRALPPCPPAPAPPCPGNSSCHRLGRGTPPQTVFLGPTFESVRRACRKALAEMLAPSWPIRRTRLLARATLPSRAVPLSRTTPFGYVPQMRNVRRTRLPLKSRLQKTPPGAPVVLESMGSIVV